MATHSSVLAWRIPGTGEPGGLPSMGSHRVGNGWSDLPAADQFKSVPSSALANSCLSSLHCCSAWSLLSLKALLLEQVKIPSWCLTSLVGLQVNFGRKEKMQTLPYLFLGGSLWGQVQKEVLRFLLNPWSVCSQSGWSQRLKKKKKDWKIGQLVSLCTEL